MAPLTKLQVRSHFYLTFSGDACIHSFTCILIIMDLNSFSKDIMVDN